MPTLPATVSSVSCRSSAAAIHCALNGTPPSRRRPLTRSLAYLLLLRHRADDLIEEDNEPALKALSRLSERERYDRIYRIRRATQLSLQHKILPKAEWTKAEEDVPYLSPILEQLQTEIKEREALDTLTVLKKH